MKLIEANQEHIFNRMKVPEERYVETKIAHYRELVEVYEKHLHILELQRAKLSFLTPSSVQLEIDEVSKKINEYQHMIDELESQI